MRVWLKQVVTVLRSRRLIHALRKRISVLLPVLLVISVFLLIRNETEALADYEASFDAVAARQLEGIAASLNQELWVATAAWQNFDPEVSRTPVFPVFVDAVLLSTGRRNQLVYQRTKTTPVPDPGPVRQAVRTRKTLPEPFFPFSDDSTVVFLKKRGTDTLFFFCDPQSFVARAVEPVLESLRNQNIEFETDWKGIRLSKAALSRPALLEKELWVFPGLKLRLSTRPAESIEMQNRRTRRALLLVGSAFAIIMLVVFGLERTIRQERQLSQLKTGFVANVSHELKTPLALIRMYAESLQMGRVASPEQQHKYFGIILKESDRLGKLINNVLQLSKIEAGKVPVKTAPLDLVHAWEQTFESFHERLEREGFLIETRFPETLKPVIADNDAMLEVLMNLIDNAIKYSEARKVIRCEIAQTDEQTLFSIADEGIGISAEDQKRLFEPFFRAESSLTPATRGTGIGLSLVKSYMEAMGGRIELSSVKESGTTIRLVLKTA